MTLSGRFVAPAILVMGIDDVLVARITPGLQTSSSFLKIFSFEIFPLHGGLNDKIGIFHIFQVGTLFNPARISFF